MSVSHGNSTGGIDTREKGIGGIAAFEDALLCGVGDIISAANAIVYVLAVAAGVGAGRITGLEAESISAHEIGPIRNLTIDSGGSTEDVREDHTAQGITAKISAVGVHFTSIVILIQVDVGLIDETSDLDVVVGFQVLETGNSTSRNETCTMMLGAPSNHFALSCTDC